MRDWLIATGRISAFDDDDTLFVGGYKHPKLSQEQIEILCYDDIIEFGLISRLRLAKKRVLFYYDFNFYIDFGLLKSNGINNLLYNICIIS
ncbi:MAG: hypothetical protein FWE14_00205 [Lachnospiraceae bacterium]|nr:hypothetical protein [Lachnospiraceae bacterium]